MNIEYLREFVTLAEQLNFTRAASFLGISQPLLSKHISSLESTLGTKLFSRDTTPIELTALGKVFYRDCQKTLLDYDQSIRRVAKLKSAHASTVKVATYTSYKPMDDLLRATRLALKREHPLLDIKVSNINPDSPHELVESGAVDMCLATIDESRRTSLRTTLLFEEPLLAVVRNDHRLAPLKTIRASDIDGDIVWNSQASPVFDHYAVIKRLLLSNGANPDFLERPFFGSPDLIELDFSEGIYVDGAGIVKHSLPLFSLESDYKALPFEEDRLKLKYYAITKPASENPDIELVISALEQTVRNVDMSMFWAL